MPGNVVVLGGGHGLAAVLRALRADVRELTALVTTADDGGSSGELRRRFGGPAVGDIRRSLIALSEEHSALARGFKRRLPVSRLGTHPLGNLVLRSLAGGFGDLAEASRLVGAQLGIAGVVLPATAEPVSLLGETAGKPLFGEREIGAAFVPIRRVGFDPPRPVVYQEALDAIAAARWVFLAPGSLFTSVLAASAVPDIADALRTTEARVVWIANLSCDPRGETSDMSARGHVAAIRSHGVRLDAVLYDPSANVAFDAAQLASQGLAAIAAPLLGAHEGQHDVPLLRAALVGLMQNDALRPRADLAGRV